MKVATYNVNGVNGRLPRLLEWLDETRPDVVCLQEIKTDDSKVPMKAIEDAGYGAIWHGQRSHHGVAILAKGSTPKETRRGLPGDATDLQSRYLEAEIGGIIAQRGARYAARRFKCRHRVSRQGAGERPRSHLGDA